MPAFDAIYTAEQRDALAYTFEDLRIRPASRVVELAAAGDLQTSDGRRLDPFETNANTVRDVARKARRSRAATSAKELGTAPAERSALVDLSPRDAVENLRRRLIAFVDQELAKLEHDQAAGKPVSGEQIRQLARAAREAASLPGPMDPRPPAPGQRVDGQRDGGETRGGLAASILRSHAHLADVPEVPEVDLPGVTEDDQDDQRDPEPDPAVAAATAPVFALIDRLEALEPASAAPDTPAHHRAVPAGSKRDDERRRGRWKAEDTSSIDLANRGRR